jgi:phenylalanyl-tRNA synthetase beta chain
LETAGGQLADGAVDVYPKPFEPKQITLHFSKSKDLLGVGISHAEQVGFLTKLGLTIAKQEPGECTFKIPSWRVDLKREVDLIEEVERLYGVKKFPPRRRAAQSVQMLLIRFMTRLPKHEEF